MLHRRPGLYTRRSASALKVNPALQFLAAPSSRTIVRRIEGQRRARLAADAGVAAVVLRQQRNPVLLRVAPHVGGRPLSERTDLADQDVVAEREELRLRERGARRRLLAAKAGEPGVVVLQGSE